VCDPYKIAEKAKTEPCLVYSIGSNGQVRPPRRVEALSPLALSSHQLF
jgi:hypothetical protein